MAKGFDALDVLQKAWEQRLTYENKVVAVHVLLALIAVGAFVFIPFVQRKNSSNYQRAKRRRRKRRQLLTRSDPPFRRAVYAGVGIAGVESISDEEGDEGDRQGWERLRQQVPESTEEECQRFFDGAEGKEKQAVKALRKYIAWREKHDRIEKQFLSKEQSTNGNKQEKMKKNLDDSSSNVKEDGDPGGDIADHEEWNVACRIARKACDATSEVEMPRCARTFSVSGDKECVDRSGYRILKLAPGRMDERLVPLSVYSRALAVYIDRKLSRDSTERIAILVDVRGGEGWRNLHVRNLVPFIKELLSNLQNLFPERLALLLVYPVPSTLKLFWKMVESALSEDIRERVHMLSGRAKIDAPTPDGMTEWIDDDIVKHIEEERLDAFEEPKQ